MKKYQWGILILVLTGIVVYFAYVKPTRRKEKTAYTYTILERGNIESSVSNTGTLDPVHKVEVGTQISGTISKIHVDYNDKVYAGQLLAEMDLRLLSSALQNAEANLAMTRTQLEQVKEDFEKSKILFEKNVIPEKEFKNAKYQYERSVNSCKSAEAAVKSAKVNLGYTRIISPINGTIIKKNVDEGQTVAASFATPTMFVIAEDLSRMQILADVDESDIGMIEDKQQVRFTVQAYPEKKFYGQVEQIRLMPVEINNVVNYKVVVKVDNKDGFLLPGMTATLEFITDTAQNILRINNSALRFKPSEEMLKQAKPLLKQKASVLPDSVRTAFLRNLENNDLYSPVGFKDLLPQKIHCVFYMDKERKLSCAFIELGIITGRYSEIKSTFGQEPLKPGMEIINSIQKK